jgi:hypothetical protein
MRVLTIFALHRPGASIPAVGLLAVALLFASLALPNRAPVNLIAGARVHPSIIPIRDPHGRMVRNRFNQSTSTNWSGYAEENFQTGLTYTAASGTWVVPAATPVSGFATAYSSAWVGVGGDCENSACTKVDKSLIQLGTESDASSTTSTYYAWYEMLPQAEIKTSLAVHPSDVIVASLHLTKQTTRSQTWLLAMTNQTTGQSWSKSVNYKSSLLSAEWIAEAPFSGGILPLANFGTLRFDPGTINSGGNPNLTVGDGIVMQNSNGMTSNPSNPDADTDGFNACWGATSTLTACSPPGS